MDPYSPFGSMATFESGFYTPQLEMSFVQQAEVLTPGIVSYAQQIATFGESLIDAIARAMNSVSMAQAQRDFLQLQVDRARQGLPPLNVDAYTPQQQPDGRTVYVPKSDDSISPGVLLALGVGAFALLRK